MKNKLLLIIPFLALCFLLVGCGGKKETKLTGFEKFANDIYSSELSLKKYEESYTISDSAMDLYIKTVKCEIERLEEQVNTKYEEVKKVASQTGNSTYEETSSSYYTQGNKKHETINGNEYITDYTVPTYFLSFVVSEDYFNEGYTLEINENDINFTGIVKNGSQSSFFLNKSLPSVTNLSVEIKIVDSKLTSFNASYTSTTGNKVTIKTTYSY